jgi:hypothetical protein
MVSTDSGAAQASEFEERPLRGANLRMNSRLSRVCRRSRKTTPCLCARLQGEPPAVYEQIPAAFSELVKRGAADASRGIHAN